MDNGEAMYWLAVVRQANEGDKEAMEMLRQEDELRTEQGQMTVVDELEYLTMSEEDKEILRILQDDSRTVWKRPKEK